MRSNAQGNAAGDVGPGSLVVQGHHISVEQHVNHVQTQINVILLSLQTPTNDPGDLDELRGQASIALRRGEFDEAMRILAVVRSREHETSRRRLRLKEESQADWIAAVRSEAETLALLARIKLLQQDAEAAKRYFEEGLHELADVDGSIRLSYMLDAATTFRGMGAYNAALEMHRNALFLFDGKDGFASLVDRICAGGRIEQFEMLPWRDMLADYAQACFIGYEINSDRDHLEPAYRMASKARSVAEAVGAVETGTEARLALAGIHRRRGLYDKAAKHLETVVAGLRSHGRWARSVAFALDSLAHVEMARGDPALAAEYLHQALGFVRHLRDDVADGIFHGNLGKAHYRLGNGARAEAEIRLALERVDQGRHPRCESYAYRVRGDVLAATDKVEAAREAYATALRIATQIGNPHCAAMANAGLGRWELFFGSSEEAVRAFDIDAGMNATHEDGALKTELLAGFAAAQAVGGSSDAVASMSCATRNLKKFHRNLYVVGWVRAMNSIRLRHDGKAIRAELEGRLSDDAFRKAAPILVGLSSKWNVR